MKNRGIAEVVLLAYVIGALVLLFVPNPVSNAIGVGVKPNKTVQSSVEKVELLRDKEGKPVLAQDGTYLVKHVEVTSDLDQQQHTTLWQSLLALPRLWLLLMFLGIFFTPVAGFMTWVNGGLKKGFKQIVTGVEEAKKNLSKESTDILESSLSKKMDTAPKALVKKIKVGL